MTTYTDTDIKIAIQTLYDSRKSRRTHPEGSFDKAMRWEPTEAEDQDGDGTCVRTPSRAWPYSYMVRCRTKAHCKALILAAVACKKVPIDALWALKSQQS